MKLLFKTLLVLIILVGAAVAGAYQLMKKADIPYAELENRYATAASKFVDLPGGVRVHYRDQGNPQGRALLLIHGFGISLETWEPWIALLAGERPLASDYRLISLDLPGHGLTRAPLAYQPTINNFADIAAQLAAVLGLDKYTVVGNSTGGRTAWNLALRHPANVAALVLIDADGWYDAARAAGRPLLFRLINSPYINNQYLAPYLANVDPRPLIKYSLEAAFADKSMVTNRIVDRYSNMALAPGHRSLLGSIGSGMAPDVLASKDTLAAIKVPTLILWGDKDELIPVSDAKKFNEAIPGSKVIIYPNIGHLPHKEAAALSASDLQAFLQGVQVAARQ